MKYLPLLLLFPLFSIGQSKDIEAKYRKEKLELKYIEFILYSLKCLNRANKDTCAIADSVGREYFRLQLEDSLYNLKGQCGNPYGKVAVVPNKRKIKRYKHHNK